MVGGISLQISDIPVQILLDEFLLEADVQAVGALDTSLNNEDYNYVTVANGVATPWRLDNPIKPIGYDQGFLKIADMLLIYPTSPETQANIQQMPNKLPAICYVGPFVIRANLTVGRDVALAGAIEASPKRFMAITDVSFFPMFPARITLPPSMPVALLNQSKVSHYHPYEE